MFRRNDKGTDTNGPDTRPTPEELGELDPLGAPTVWTFKTATAWCRCQNWHLDGIEAGQAVWVAGSAYMAQLSTPVIPDMSVRTPATFDRAAQTGEWTLFINNLENQRVYSVGTVAPQ